MCLYFHILSLFLPLSLPSIFFLSFHINLASFVFSAMCITLHLLFIPLFLHLLACLSVQRSYNLSFVSLTFTEMFSTPHLRFIVLIPMSSSPGYAIYLFILTQQHAYYTCYIFSTMFSKIIFLFTCSP